MKNRPMKELKVFFKKQNKCPKISWVKDEHRIQRAVCKETGMPCKPNNCPKLNNTNN